MQSQKTTFLMDDTNIQNDLAAIMGNNIMIQNKVLSIGKFNPRDLSSVCLVNDMILICLTRQVTPGSLSKLESKDVR